MVMPYGLKGICEDLWVITFFEGVLDGNTEFKSFQDQKVLSSFFSFVKSQLMGKARKKEKMH